MCLARNYCDSEKSRRFRPQISAQVLNVTTNEYEKWVAHTCDTETIAVF